MCLICLVILVSSISILLNTNSASISFNLTTEARLSGQHKPKRKSPRRALELRTKIKELSLAGLSPVQTAKIIGKTKQAVFLHLKNLVQDGELTQAQTNYQKAGPLEDRKWYKVIESAIKDLDYYNKVELVPTARKHAYRKIELALAAKAEGKTPDQLEDLGLPVLPDIHDKKYPKAKKSFCSRFYRWTAEARRGVDWTYTKISKLPKMPLNCYRDDTRETTGYTDMDKPPHLPTPDESPEDPFEVTKEAIWTCQAKIKGYDGLCYEGDKGENPGKMYLQPNYCEIMCESETVQPDLEKFQGDIHCPVTAMRGQFSTPIMAECCERFERIARKYTNIKKITVLYFGDSDKAGNNIRRKVQVALKYYSGGSEITLDNGKRLKIPMSPDIRIPVPVELVHVAITPEQVETYGLTGFQLEAFMTNEKRLRDFKKIERNAIKGCWNEEIWLNNCPPEEYDYEGNGIEKPEDIDVDNELFEDTDMTKREKMFEMATEAFKPGWGKETSDKD